MAKTKKAAAPKPIDAKAVRLKLKMSQSQFWPRFGVTQSGSSRYENGRTIPNPVMKLLTIAHGTEAQRKAILAELVPQ